MFRQTFCFNKLLQSLHKALYPKFLPLNRGYTRKNAQVATDLQTGCNKVVVKPISGCVRTACSQLLWQVWNKLLSPCYKVDDGNRLATSCSNKINTGCSYNKLLRACCHQLVDNLLRADNGLINLIKKLINNSWRKHKEKS
jgi:hypothetical protein